MPISPFSLNNSCSIVESFDCLTINAAHKSDPNKHLNSPKPLDFSSSDIFSFPNLSQFSSCHPLDNDSGNMLIMAYSFPNLTTLVSAPG